MPLKICRFFFQGLKQLACCSFCCYKDMYLVLIVQAFFNIYFLVCLFAAPSDIVYS